MSKEKTQKDPFIQEAITLPGIILAIVGNTNRKTINKSKLESNLRQFSIRDVDEAITFLQYKGLIATEEYKTNGDFSIYLTF